MLTIEPEIIGNEDRRYARIKQLLRRIRRNEGETFIWKRSRLTRCFRCRRSIERGDPYRIETFYDDDGPVETYTHRLACEEYSERSRPPVSRARVYIIERGRIRRLIMAEESEVPEETTEDRPRRKRRKKSKSKRKKKGSKRKRKSSRKKSSSSSDEASSGRSAAASIAETLSEIESFSTTGVTTIVRSMAKGTTPSNDDLVKLREHIKAEAARLREEGSGSDASRLSAVNRHVRRLERSTR